MTRVKPACIVNEWNVYHEPHGFYCANNGKTIWFTAEYRNGTYFKIKSYSDGKRHYISERYFYKLIPLVQEMTFNLLKNGYLWDYKNDCSALDSYKKDMFPYYQKCKEKGLEISLFLESLYM